MIASHPEAQAAPEVAARHLLAWCLAVAWLGSAGGAFWFHALRYQRPFETSPLTMFDTEARAREAEAWYRMRLGPAAARATVVSLQQQDCQCTRFTAAHLARIAARYQPAGVRFVTLDPRAGPAWITTTPAALVFDAGGRLAYFGPYTDSGRCGTQQGHGLVEAALDALLRGRPAAAQPFYGSGCFCGRPGTGAA